MTKITKFIKKEKRKKKRKHLPDLWRLVPLRPLFANFAFIVSNCWCCNDPQLNTLGMTRYVQLYPHKIIYIPWGDRIVCDHLFIPLPHAVFRGFVSIFRGWILLYKELIMAEEGPQITMRCVTTVALVFLLVLTCCDAAQAKVITLW